MSENNHPMLNKGTDLEVINNAAKEYREQELRTKKPAKKVAISCAVAGTALIAIYGLFFAGAIPVWLTTALACGVSWCLGMRIGKSGV